MRVKPSLAAFALALTILPAAAGAQTTAETAAPSEATAPEAPAPEKSPEERAVEAKAVALRDALVRMQDELVAAWPDGDNEAIIAPYRVQADDLADAVEAFLNTQAETAEPEAAQALRAEASQNGPKIRAMPDLIARTVLHALANPKPAPESGAEPSPSTPTPDPEQ